MNVIVIGAGRMGVRHVQGILTVDQVAKVTVIDINQGSLDTAKEVLSSMEASSKCEFVLNTELDKSTKYDVGIMASTANNREELFDLMVGLGCKDIMVEKPLGQSYQEVLDFTAKAEESNVNCCVNLNMRLYDDLIKVKNDLINTPQLQGHKTISMNTGAVGIGANGIHYLDLLSWFLDADREEVQAAHISETIIPSGRGVNFGDFGGWIAIDYFQGDNKVGTALLSATAESTVFGSWDIIAPHGRIHFSEVEEKRISRYRKADSDLPLNRYHGDYMATVEEKFEAPMLGDLTAKWLVGLQNGQQLLPNIGESGRVHKLMFDWLNYSKTHKETFPIT